MVSRGEERDFTFSSSHSLTELNQHNFVSIHDDDFKKRGEKNNIFCYYERFHSLFYIGRTIKENILLNEQKETILNISLLLVLIEDLVALTETQLCNLVRCNSVLCVCGPVKKTKWGKSWGGTTHFFLLFKNKRRLNSKCGDRKREIGGLYTKKRRETNKT